MLYLLFPFFLIRLGLSLIIFIFKVALDSFSWSISLLLVGCLLAFQFFWFLDRTIFSTQKVNQATLDKAYRQQYQLRLTQLETDWEKLRRQQPTDRDVLLNLSLINGELGKKDQQALFQQQAFEVDPNFSP